MQAMAEGLWARTRQARIGFVAGIIVGALAGWFFHGLITFIIRFFFVIVLLIPFAVALYAWWRLRREVRRVRGNRDEWADQQRWLARTDERRRPREPTDGGTIITVDSWDRDRGEPAERHPTRDRGPEG